MEDGDLKKEDQNIMRLKLRISTVIVLGVLLVFSALLLANDKEQEHFTFRNTRWGMSKSEVIEKEGEPDNQKVIGTGGYEEVILYTKLTVIGLDTTLGYVFTEDKLVRAIYDFEETHRNRNRFIDDFEKVKKALTQKYGEPISDREIWDDDLYKDDPSSYGAAVAVEDLTYQTTWETEETKIWMTLYGDNYEIIHNLYYDSKEYKELVKEKKKEQAQSKL